jgi:hypothetical protein
VRSAPADKVDDFDAIALADGSSAEGRSFQDDQIVLNRYTSWVDLQPSQQLGDSQRTVDLDALAVDHDQHVISPPDLAQCVLQRTARLGGSQGASPCDSAV